MNKPLRLTAKQAIEGIRVCAQLTRFYKQIDLVRFDERTGNIYILAADPLQAEVTPNGKVNWI